MANVVDLNKQRMDALTAGLPSKSAKMRRLAKAGFKRADIARYLGVRYQFVYNVLSAPRPSDDPGRESSRVKLEKNAERSKSQGGRTPAPAAPKWAWVTVERGGRVELPAAFLSALGVREGDQVQLALEGDSIRVLTRAAALRELRAQARRFVPEGVSLVDELIAERRAEADRDSMDG